MASPTPTPPSPPSTSASPSSPTTTAASTTSEDPYHGTPPWLHNMCIAAAVLAPVGILAPPRGGTPRNALLAGGFFLATSTLVHDYTGRGLHARFGDRFQSIFDQAELPEKAQARRALMQAERARREALAQQTQQGAIAVPAVPAQGQKQQVAQDGGDDVDAPRWKRERAAREKEAFESGRGYWDLIADQVWEVWNQGTKGKAEKGEGEGEGQKEKDSNAASTKESSR